MADGLIEADSQNPQFIVDCATLTGTAKVAVGNDYHSVISMDDALVKAYSKPLKKKMNHSGVCLLKRSIVAKSLLLLRILPIQVQRRLSRAQVLQRHFIVFCENYQQRWLHIDCSAAYRKSGSDLWAASALQPESVNENFANLSVTKAS